MMTYEAAKQLFDGAGLPLTESHFAQFQCYLAELTETNRHMNLTAITEPAEAWEKHFWTVRSCCKRCSCRWGRPVLTLAPEPVFPAWCWHCCDRIYR